MCGIATKQNFLCRYHQYYAHRNLSIMEHKKAHPEYSDSYFLCCRYFSLQIQKYIMPINICTYIIHTSTHHCNQRFNVSVYKEKGSYVFKKFTQSWHFDGGLVRRTSGVQHTHRQVTHFTHYTLCTHLQWSNHIAVATGFLLFSLFFFCLNMLIIS